MKRLFLGLVLIFVTTLEVFGYSIDDIPNNWSFSNDYSTHYSTRYSETFQRGVKYLQILLSEDLGIYVSVDGGFGNKTKSAVKRFQSKYGSYVDGIVGKNTKRKLDDVLQTLRGDNTEVSNPPNGDTGGISEPNDSLGSLGTDDSEPTISSINPNPITVSYSKQTIIINGSNFTSSSRVEWQSSTGAGKYVLSSRTTFVNSSQIKIYITVIEKATYWKFRVVNGSRKSSWKRVNIKQNSNSQLPKPNIVSINYPHSINQGEYATITVKVKNEGAFSDAGYITVSFPNIIDKNLIKDLKGDGNKNIYSINDSIYYSNGNYKSAQYLMVESYISNWSKNEIKTLNFKIKMSKKGSNTFLTRVAMRKGESSEFVHVPTSGTLDQQGWYAESRIINVKVDSSYSDSSEEEGLTNQPSLVDIEPKTIKASLYEQTIQLTGTNFTKDTIIEFSFDNKTFKNSYLKPKLLSSKILTFHTMFYSKTGYIYYRVRNNNGTPSNSIKLTVQNSSSNNKPRVFNNGKDNYAINSGETISLQLLVMDMEDMINTYQNHITKNYILKIDWGDKRIDNLYKSYNEIVPIISHTYNTNKTKPYTITIQAIDSDGYKSKAIRIPVKVKGSSSNNSISIKKIAIGNKVIAKDPCHKYRSVLNSIDKATGAENFSITPLKVKGVFELPFTLQYNSLLLSEGDISKGWSHNYTVSSYLEVAQHRSSIRVYWDNSVKKYNDFNLSNTKNVYISTDKATQDDILTFNENDETFTLKRKNGTIYKYNSDGYLKSISNYKNQKIEITFDDDGKLKKVEEPISGVSLRYYYNSDGKLDRVKDSLGRLAYLQYNENGLLYRVEFPDETDHYFFYNENDQMYRREVRKMVNGELKEVQIFHLYYIDDARVSGEEDGNNNLATFTYKIEDNKIYSIYVNKARKKIETIYNATTLNPEYIKYPDGTTEEFTYYPNGKIKTKTDRAKHTTRYYYGDKGNMNRVVYDDNSEEQYEYDDNRNIIVKKIIDKNQKAYITRNRYDSDNNLKDTELPNGEHITYTYNRHNQITSKTVGGKTTTYKYDSKGYLREVETPEGLITSYTYDKAGRLVTETNPQGGVTRYTYDDMDRVKVIENPDGKTKTFEYDMMGNKIQEKDFNGNITKYEYDNNGNLVKKIDALNHEYRFEYDSADRLKKSYDPLGYYVEYNYDSMGRVKETIDKRGNKTTYEYDAMGNLKEEFDPYGNRLYTKTYDVKNNLIKVVDALNHTTTTDYTVFDKPSKIIDPLQHITEFKYDALGRLEKVINAKQQEATQEYNPTGTLKQFTDSGENTTKFTYDDDGNLLTTTTASNSMTQNIYEKGLLSKFINGRGDTKTFKYDKLNRVIEAKDKDGTIVYTYDNNGNLLTITENGKSAIYTYDELDRVTSYTDINGNRIRYDYDEVGNLKRLYYPNNHYIEYKYDENSNLIEVKDDNLKTTYEYDKNNRLIKLTRPNKTVMTRTYKSTGQLETQTDKTSTGEVIYSVTFEYDEAGNIKSETRVPPLKPNLPINLTMSYKKGNLLKDANQTQAVFDDDDNMISFGAKTYSYDSRNRLIQDNTATYSYDSQNHRIAQTINGKTTTYTINPNATLSQLLELKEPNGEKTTYIYGLGLLYQEKGGKRLYYHYDLRGSTIALTDKNGNIVDRFSYLPFGGKMSHDLGNTQTPFLYNGRDGVMSDISGLYYMRARYYDPTLRRFINRDTLLGEIGEMASLNRFAYVNGNPISGVDPSGKIAQAFIGGIVGAVVDGGIELMSQLIIDKSVNWSKVGEVAVEGAVFGAVTGGVGNIVKGAKVLSKFAEVFSEGAGILNDANKFQKRVHYIGSGFRNGNTYIKNMSLKPSRFRQAAILKTQKAAERMYKRRGIYIAEKTLARVAKTLGLNCAEEYFGTNGIIDNMKKEYELYKILKEIE